MVLRRRESSTEPAQVDNVPPELYQPGDVVWATAAATVRWLERQNLRRRMRGTDDLDDMGPKQRFKTAALEWAVSMGHPSTYDLERKCFPNRAYLRELGIVIPSDTQERLAGVRIKTDDE